MKKPSHYIKCLNNEGIAKGKLTVYKSYKIRKISPNFQQYEILDDNGNFTWWSEERFEQ